MLHANKSDFEDRLHDFHTTSLLCIVETSLHARTFVFFYIISPSFSLDFFPLGHAWHKAFSGRHGDSGFCSCESIISIVIS
jgi:hypothetical protein